MHQLDIGWFAKASVFGFDRSNPPVLARRRRCLARIHPSPVSLLPGPAPASSSPSLSASTASAPYTLDRLTRLKNYLAAEGIHVHGATENHGAFLTLPHPDSASLCAQLRQQNIATDARPQTLRLGPDLLTTDAELKTTAATLASISAT